ncbi:MAG: helix-turn-helix domain-containing protein [Elusimicrobiota bacterium]
MAEAERIHILRVLADAEGNKTKAAKILEVDVKTLYNKLKKYGVDLSEQDYSAS